MTAPSEMTTLSIRVPKQTRDLITDAAKETRTLKGPFIVQAALALAEQVLEHDIPPDLLPDNFEIDQSGRAMVTAPLYPSERESLDRAAERCGGIPTSRFIVWAALLESLSVLNGKE